MAIARIQIDFTLLEGEKLEDFLHFFGEVAVDVLDPHEEDEECVRWVAIEGCLADENEYMVEFTPDEEDEPELLTDLLRQNAEFN